MNQTAYIENKLQGIKNLNVARAELVSATLLTWNLETIAAHLFTYFNAWRSLNYCNPHSRMELKANIYESVVDIITRMSFAGQNSGTVRMAENIDYLFTTANNLAYHIDLR